MPLEGISNAVFSIHQPGRVLGELLSISSFLKADIFDFHFHNCTSLGSNVLCPVLGILLSKITYLHLKRTDYFFFLTCFVDHEHLSLLSTLWPRT